MVIICTALKASGLDTYKLAGCFGSDACEVELHPHNGDSRGIFKRFIVSCVDLIKTDSCFGDLNPLKVGIFVQVEVGFVTDAISRWPRTTKSMWVDI